MHEPKVIGPFTTKVNDLLSEGSDCEKEARTILMCCATRLFHCPVDSITNEQLVDPRVEYLFYLEVPVENRQLYAAARTICISIDGTQKYFTGKYKKVRHPLLEQHATFHSTTDKMFDNIIYDGMQLLEYLCGLPYFRLQRPFDFKVSLIKREHLLGFRAALLKRIQRGEVVSASQRIIFGHIIRWLRELQANGFINKSLDFTGLIIPKSLHRQRKLIDLRLLENALQGKMADSKYAGTILYVLLELVTGARPNELTRLTKQHIDANSNSIWLQSKNSYGRWIPLPPALWDAVQNYVTSRNLDQEECILRSATGKPFTPQTIGAVLRNFIPECPIDGMVAFRHTFATGALKAGIPSHITSHILGHKDPASLQTYQRVGNDFVRKEVNRAYIDWGE